MSKRLKWFLLGTAVALNMAVFTAPASSFYKIGYCSTCSGGSGHYDCCVYSGVCEDPQPGTICCDSPSECALN